MMILPSFHPLSFILHPSIKLLIGLDVGSTAVKAAVMAPSGNAVLWSDYRRHAGRQHETCLSFLSAIEGAFPDVPAPAMRVVTTGTGGAAIGPLVGAGSVQEVNAVCMAVEACCPDARSVVELGGEDAKIVAFLHDPATGRRKKTASMNDKCAGGTGAVIDKISARLGIGPDAIADMAYTGVKVHPVAGKCGVFAETDIVGLHKQGVAPRELMASLFESLVQQNLSVLARGRLLLPPVLLLGGPNVLIRGMQECWRHHLMRLWRERDADVPREMSPEALVRVPEHALLFAALGAIEHARSELRTNPEFGVYTGTERLRSAKCEVRGTKAADGCPRTVTRPASRTSHLALRTSLEAFLGVDAGSTSTKAVLLDRRAQVVAKAYRLSCGNPIDDARHVIGALREEVGRVDVLGAAVTGYAKDILKDVIGADVVLVETVAHMQGGLHCCPSADVICDVGGQDIKILFLKSGAVSDFRLNTQCSAGTGYYLQSTAESFGYRIEEYADIASTATALPEFGYGCAVFLQSEIVDFQRQGWRPNEILAGLAAVLPKNIWHHVCQMPDLVRAGRTFVLQGGVHRNLAAVNAHADFIRARFRGAGVDPHIVVHEHCGEAGAIGCALEVYQRHRISGHRRSAFIGFDALQSTRYTVRSDESTRCRRCSNQCARTFIDLTHDAGSEVRRVIVARCEDGAVEHSRKPRNPKPETRNPNLAAVAAITAFQSAPVVNAAPSPGWLTLPARRRALKRRAHTWIGMPRVLGLYATAPFFLGYFRSLGVPPEHVVWSDYTSEQLYRSGAMRGSIDPCYPTKLVIAHIENLLSRRRADEALLTHIFFPAIDALPTWIEDVQASRGCPAASAATEAVYAAFVKDGDPFADHGIRFKRTFVDLSRPALCAHQMCEDWADEIGVSEAESRRAVREGFKALEHHHASLRRHGRAILTMLEDEQRVGIVLLARPYHLDPGINHGICETFRRLGYPILTIESLPIDGEQPGFLRIGDVWKNSFSENSSRKLWAAKFAARHPNLLALDLSSFKCGHDAPLCAVLEAIMACAGKPLLYFRDLDENTPAASIKLRVETFAHVLERRRERLTASREPGPETWFPEGWTDGNQDPSFCAGADAVGVSLSGPIRR